MAHDPRLQDIADLLEGVKWNWNDNGFTACCPAHADNTPSFSVNLGDKVDVVYHCHAGCTQEEVLAAIRELQYHFAPATPLTHVERTRTSPLTPDEPVTVAEIAADKKLPEDFLRSLGIENRPDGVLIPYRMMNGSSAPRQRLRKTIVAKNGSLWLPGAGKPVPYGLWRCAEEGRPFLLLVEGESDCWVLWYKHFPALGIPGADMTGKLEAEYVAQFDRIYVWREPDRGGDTFVAGIADRLRKIEFKGVVREICGANLSVKDPADLWKRDPVGFKHALREAIQQAREIVPTESVVNEPGAGLILDPQDPMAFARVFIEHCYTQDGTRTLIFHGGQLLGWCGGAYSEIESGALQAAGYRFLEGAFRRTRYGLQPFRPNQALVSELFAAVKAQVHLSIEIVPPVWLNGEGPVPAGELLGVENGLLHLPSGRMFPHSPHLFARNVLPVAFVPDAGKSPEWSRFLQGLFETDKELRNTLQEMFGYFLTPDTKQQKIFMLVGPKRAGKGVIGRVLTGLLRRDNVCGPTLASLGTTFGLSTLVGKQLAIISDARLGSRADQHVLAERLLSISGEDGACYFCHIIAPSK
jgi:putative DNA primase/helicase